MLPLRQQGFTLTEMLVVVTIVGVMAAMALPSFGEFLQQERLRSVRADFMKALIVARSTAIKSGTPVVLCSSNSGVQCSRDWQEGWLVFTDDNDDGKRQLTEALIYRYQPDGDELGVRVLSLSGVSLSTIRFNFRGLPDEPLNATFTQDNDRQQLAVNAFGRPRIE